MIISPFMVSGPVARTQATLVTALMSSSMKISFRYRHCMALLAKTTLFLLPVYSPRNEHVLAQFEWGSLKFLEPRME
jgi:hypothetical protein